MKRSQPSQGVPLWSKSLPKYLPVLHSSGAFSSVCQSFARSGFR